MAYSSFDDMYTDLGLVMQRNRLTYSLGEMETSEVVLQGVKPGSVYGKQMIDPVVADGLLYDRSAFHGTGTVLVHSVEAINC